MRFGILERASDALKFIPWIGMSEYWFAVLCIGVLGPLLTLLPTAS